MEAQEDGSTSKIDEMQQELIELIAESQKLVDRTSEINNKRKKTPKVQLYVPVIFSEDEDVDVPTLSDEEFDQLLLDIQQLPLSTIDVLKLMLQQLEENILPFDAKKIEFNIRNLKKSTLRIMKTYVDSKMRQPELPLELIPKRLTRSRRALKKTQIFPI